MTIIIKPNSKLFQLLTGLLLLGMAFTSAAYQIDQSTSSSPSNSYLFIGAGYSFNSRTANSILFLPADGFPPPSGYSEQYKESAKSPIFYEVGAGLFLPKLFNKDWLTDNALEFILNYRSMKINGTRAEVNIQGDGSAYLQSAGNFNYISDNKLILVNYVLGFKTPKLFIQPFLFVGAGINLYHIGNYNESISGVNGAQPYFSAESFQNNSGANFAYNAGIGLKAKFTDHFSTSINYRYLNLGNTSLGAGMAVNQGNKSFSITPVKISGITNEVYLRLIYLI